MRLLSHAAYQRNSYGHGRMKTSTVLSLPFDKASNFDFDVALNYKKSDRALLGMEDLKGRDVVGATLS